MQKKWRTIIEPFRIKSVEPLGFTTERERERLLARSGFNLFNIPADKVLIDLLTDSGTSAMSSEQWAAIMRGDESYAGARSFFIFEKRVRELTGYNEVIPVHQGRAAERIMFSFMGGPGKVVLANAHFDTTRANIEASGAKAVDLPVPAALDPSRPAPFKGDMDTVALQSAIRRYGARRIPMVIMTITNNTMGGQPVSMKNLVAVKRVCSRHKIPVIIDCARFAENAYFIKKREKGFSGMSVESIARKMFSHADGCMMSAKKDALVNIGGFLALKDVEWAQRAREVLILTEGFPTYGGLAGRDLEAMAQGLIEVMDEEYLHYRLRSVEYLGEGLRRVGVPILEPPGGHAVYVDAKAFLPDILPQRYPGQVLACELYRTAGVRACEIGSLMFGKVENKRFIPAKLELLRLAIPRRVYTQSHMDFLIEVFADIAARKTALRGLRVVWAPQRLAHFRARLAPV